jgi:hypothetical protein
MVGIKVLEGEMMCRVKCRADGVKDSRATVCECMCMYMRKVRQDRDGEQDDEMRQGGKALTARRGRYDGASPRQRLGAEAERRERVGCATARGKPWKGGHPEAYCTGLRNVWDKIGQLCGHNWSNTVPSIRIFLAVTNLCDAKLTRNHIRSTLSYFWYRLRIVITTLLLHHTTQCRFYGDDAGLPGWLLC